MTVSSASRRDRVVLLHCYPPTPCLYPFEKGLRELGHEVIAFGPAGMYGDSSQFQALEPDCHYTAVPAAISVDELFDLAGGQPDWLLYLQPNGALLPRGLRDCPVPTVGWLTEEYKSADVDQGLYYYFDLAPTPFPQIARMYHDRGYDHRVCFNFTGCNWLQPDVNPDERPIDVAFVGTTNPVLSRDRCRELEKLLRLRQFGINVAVRNGVFLRDMLNLYAQSKIVFQHSGQGDNNLTYRVSEAMSAGALVLARRPEHVGGMGDHPLVEGKHIVYYDDFDEAEALIRHYSTHEDERRAIADEATRYIEQEYPWVSQIEWFLDEFVHRIPEDFLERRHDRLARFGVDERRELMDYARYFVVSVGHGTQARSLVEEIPNWETDADARILHGLCCRVDMDPDAYQDDIDFIADAGAECPLSLYNHAALVFSGREELGYKLALEELLSLGRRLEAMDPDDFEGAAIDGAASTATSLRERLEVARAHFDLPPGRERGRRLYSIYSWYMETSIGTLHSDLEQWELAITRFEKALEFTPDDGYIMADLGRALLHAGRTEDALELARAAVKAEPFFTGGRLGLGTLLLATGNVGETVALMLDTLVTSLRSDASHYEAYGLLVQAHAQGGDIVRARKALVAASRELNANASGTEVISAAAVEGFQQTFRAMSRSLRASAG